VVLVRPSLVASLTAWVSDATARASLRTLEGRAVGSSSRPL
jgi:hypothetical protein